LLVCLPKLLLLLLLPPLLLLLLLLLLLQVQIELKPAESNPCLGVEHITADRSFVKARPGA
jgi:hypothetical protein